MHVHSECVSQEEVHDWMDGWRQSWLCGWLGPSVVVDVISGRSNAVAGCKQRAKSLHNDWSFLALSFVLGVHAPVKALITLQFKCILCDFAETIVNRLGPYCNPPWIVFNCRNRTESDVVGLCNWRLLSGKVEGWRLRSNLVPEKTLTLTKLLYCDESEMCLYGLLSGFWTWLELVNIN